MIYFIYLLILVFIALLLLKLSSFRRHSSLAPARTNALEHDDLLTLLDKFNYTHDNGVCHGFTLTWAQEAAQGYDVQFYNRLNLIKREKDTLADSLQRITEKIKSSRTLSKREEKRTEIRPFLEAICLAQSPEDYPDVYAKAIQQSNIDTIYKIIRLNLSKKQNTVKSLLNKTMSMANPEELTEFLTRCNNLLTIKNQVVVVFSSEEHTVGFKKQADNTWLFMDINHLYEQSEDYPYQILTSEELCPKLYGSLFETSEQLVCHCCFIAKSGQKKLNQNLSALNTLYPITAENLQISNCRGFGLLALAVQNDDITAVRKILRIHQTSSILSSSELENALFYAAACNRFTIMKLLSTIPGLDLNSACSGDDSALAVACRYGHEAIVRLLLDNPSIQVDVRSTKNMTPLMLACRSSSTVTNRDLFQLLLEAGANLDLRNSDGQTAADLAQDYDNNAALQAIASYSIKTGYKPKPDASSLLATKKEVPGLVSFLSHSLFGGNKAKMPFSAAPCTELSRSLNI
ncbi:Dot/Icm T4SS effector AnkG/AnkZ/LegA7 [Legionella sp. km772]|uniref:Dot/Icm T4SS effector AnkG/AnkZ/LegA7 n=1 Tax=Legionella sp. km772 TaxID=2498111 RepID=UPI000F8D93DF|nr:Dot/Icm T4SS effector AnkG/AnkZ/LegA7 [Legionella sp. km772]RUR04769.1 ankyrin repeat domain-containing protein [Legionella sp. km772]